MARTAVPDRIPAPGPYLQTVSGRRVNPFDPDPDQIDIGDIGRALANQCRFGGHCRVFYSVAQHPLGAAFRAAEEHLERALRDRFGIRADVPEIKRADRAVLATERRAFSAESWHWPELDGVEPLDLELEAWSPDEAERALAARYAELAASRRRP